MFCGYCEARTHVNKVLFGQSATLKLQGECYQTCRNWLCVMVLKCKQDCLSKHNTSVDKK